ncbi:MAG: hypothetical protein IKD59_02110 [Lachnospiraceae bacterium]|nr:hypothetical protein [Lachnospiraceae bacterium]MBR3278162.1 hypothetical protein [Lachnospiraceae bacterium]
MKSDLTDEQVELEIERLSKSPLVKLARKEQRLKNARRQNLYTLRYLEKRGQELKDSGITYEKLDELARMQRNDYDPLEDADGEDWL